MEEAAPASPTVPERITPKMALMNLGIQREVLEDLLLQEDPAAILRELEEISVLQPKHAGFFNSLADKSVIGLRAEIRRILQELDQLPEGPLRATIENTRLKILGPAGQESGERTAKLKLFEAQFNGLPEAAKGGFTWSEILNRLAPIDECLKKVGI